jgi:hypothetical protein
MRSRIDESPRRPQDRDRQPGSGAAEEPRNFHLDASEIATSPQEAHPGFDADLNPIDDELINTHGSER